MPKVVDVIGVEWVCSCRRCAMFGLERARCPHCGDSVERLANGELVDTSPTLAVFEVPDR